MNESNILIDTDSYKASHFLQYPPGLERLHAYLESRGGQYPYVRFFGLQYILQRYLSTPVTLEMVEEARELFAAHGEPFPYEGWKLIATELQGRIPLEIRAVPEGSVVPNHNVLMTVTNTDPRVPWVVSWFETQLLRVWYPSTVATQSYQIKCVLRAALEQSCEHPEAELPFKLHDFGSRGVSSRESAGIGGLAHLTNFQGSDTVEALRCGRNYYAAEMAAFSIPAAEHSTITAWGKEHEVDAYRHMITTFSQPGALVSVVADSYDLKHAITELFGSELRQQIIDSGATVVVRPDSGDPPAVVRMAVNALASRFGTTTNAKGYRVLRHVRVIQGDGVREDTIRQILDAVMNDGFSAENVTFGMGGALLQMINRDTQRFAYKTSAAIVNGQYRPVYKDPLTDPGKRSKDGVLDLVLENGRYRTVAGTEFGVSQPGSVLRTVFRDGELLVRDTLEQIRARG
ncbi:nicotinamide phosphoribosyltransferase [Deinobacterium chartae]|uniref:Nicotinamide phosphoribosyltransferase n=1 Tax=Deinobacterium chartae TaxID=521158 RepID=A0A841I3W7_9DEIO|nr:nicotinate phosphoribosyltransferase [Deinobacterium chartae]MBB6098702.1 nicotinamide phosphoribosyltransferase [Deinobacterium chartae]